MTNALAVERTHLITLMICGFIYGSRVRAHNPLNAVGVQAAAAWSVCPAIVEQLSGETYSGRHTVRNDIFHSITAISLYLFCLFQSFYKN